MKLDDPFGQALRSTPNAERQVVAIVGPVRGGWLERFITRRVLRRMGTRFLLDHWSVKRLNGEMQMDSAWVEAVA